MAISSDLYGCACIKLNLSLWLQFEETASRYGGQL